MRVLPSPSHRRRSSLGEIAPRLAPLLLGAVLLGGCASGSVSMLTPISGGEKIAVPLGRGGVEPTESDGIKIETIIFTLNDDKRLVYPFAFTDAKKRPLRSVRVEDVSEPAPLLIVEDTAPAPADGRWHATSRPFPAGDRHLAWMSTITNTVRVFRFTITFADGKELVLHQGAMFPAFVKSGVRRVWGENY